MKTIADALMSHCPDDQNSCSTKPIDLGRVSLILNEGREYMNLQANLDGSHYSSKESRDFMIATISLGTVSAARNQCERTMYREAVQGGFGCPDPDHTKLSYKRDILSSYPYKDPSPEEHVEPKLEARIGNGNADKPERTCNFITNMCAGPTSLHSINGNEGDPYQDDMLLRFELVAPPDALGDTASWFCKTSLGLLAGLALGKLPGHAADILGIGGIPPGSIEIICGKYIPDQIPKILTSDLTVDKGNSSYCTVLYRISMVG
ncbi:hypothetical protein NLU13_0943 [Sarocladium strictum]|uniref:Uncharacterized protein n=1 Tax=Sarocladium strictum TaxID=5046 RepID=A0AA39LBS1_SARSR|nr:hypothetical protein NLU13_0943 [Sarocladium strictum]